MPVNTINDSDVVFGSLPLTIGSQAFETSDLALAPEIKRYLRESSKGIPTGKIVIKGETTGTATLVYPSSTVLSPLFGASFTVTLSGTGASALSCTVEKVGETRTMGNQAYVPITFSVNIGTVTTATS